MQVRPTEAPISDKVNQHCPVPVRPSGATVVEEYASICAAAVITATLTIGHWHDAAKVEVTAVVSRSPARLAASMAQHPRLEAGAIETLNNSNAVLAAHRGRPVGHYITMARAPIAVRAVEEKLEAGCGAVHVA